MSTYDNECTYDELFYRPVAVKAHPCIVWQINKMQFIALLYNSKANGRASFIRHLNVILFFTFVVVFILLIFLGVKFMTTIGRKAQIY